MEKKTILIIEDNFEIREGTAEILELTGGYNILTAENGKLGVEMATKHLPDLILCDIMMPELDGYGVLYMLNKYDSTSKIPFIFLTAKSERADMRKAMEMGADDYLIKPFDDVELFNAIESRFRKRDKLLVSAEGRSNLELSEEEQNYLLQDLVKDSRIKTFRKKQSIFEAGDNPIFLYFIISGKVRSYLYYQDGRELSTGIHIDEQFFGYESLLLNEKYSDNASALEESELALIPKERFYELMIKKTGIAGKFIKLLSGNVKEKEEQMLGFAYDSVRKRVANALVNVADKTAKRENGDEVLIRISRDDLAALAGTANETISRMLADFKDEKLIIKEGNAIRIFSISKLRNIKQ
ncbi:response regulator [Sphingobacterium alkalisoli]|uniref:Response regulator n=1 Tax=Sphingobacterium alkalisoli TaxID=1874115 RepID=A0A4U0GX57_9SPHI|nr:response regulator [Sphingobacterium alkalisoli]TJY62402.1 response regulator [Sphingobacterium alkalisoli]GGH29685.1 transcriptional regulator [Sphingobacterium alkalisoli]